MKLKNMKSLKIEINSFTHLKKDKWDEDKAKNQTIQLLNYDELKSKSVYGDGFELKYLSKWSKLIRLKVIHWISNIFICDTRYNQCSYTLIIYKMYKLSTILTYQPF